MSAGNNCLAATSSQIDVESPVGMPRMCEMNEPDSPLSAALRRLGRIAPRSAPPALGQMLKDEFRRHHVRRRRERNARIFLAAACLAASAATLLILRPRPSNTSAKHAPLPITLPSRANISAGLIEPKTTPQRAVKSRASNRTKKNPASAADR